MMNLRVSSRRFSAVAAPLGAALMLAFVGMAPACGSSSDDAAAASSPAADAGVDAAPGDMDPTPVGGARPAKVFVPGTYQKSTPAPLVVLLHGFGASGQLQELLFNLKPLADQHGFLYVYPDGTSNKKGQRFWNATDACCANDPTAPDDVAYLTGLVDEIASRWSVDPKRVYFIGHSNGGFMSYRMACDRADRVAAIGSLAGAMWLDKTRCAPSGPVAVMQVHGDADDTVLYAGSTSPTFPTPSAKQSVLDWVEFDGCQPTEDTSAPPRDLDKDLAGAESTGLRWSAGCKGGTAVELWTIAGGGHIPSLTDDFRKGLVDFLLAHPKP